MTAEPHRHVFTVEGDPSAVLALAASEGWRVFRPKWWQRTYAVPRWLCWLVTIQSFLGLARFVEWVS